MKFYTSLFAVLILFAIVGLSAIKTTDPEEINRQSA